MELDLRFSRSSNGYSSRGSNQRQAKRPNIPCDQNQLIFVQAQIPNYRHRFDTHRTRHQPQHRAHPLLLYHHVNLLRRLSHRLCSGRSRGLSARSPARHLSSRPGLMGWS
ncbi:hypothetical protein OIU77_017241 [Salix suchowensis]|uniref:Uncharacterized protein n=1 Tax=Salix suchowensis TaxID=1278906 RepID=A0ABQ8ZNQ5_9ROSI|nr:hypothetical protein OIU77_017241 [Salix suchowensis]